MAFENFADVAADLPRFIDQVNNERRLVSALGYLSQKQFEDHRTRHPVKTASWSCPSAGALSTCRRIAEQKLQTDD